MSASGEHGTWTGKVREAAVAALPPERLLPETQPVYVSSWVYVFGVLTLAAFVLVLASGALLAMADSSVAAISARPRRGGGANAQAGHPMLRRWGEEYWSSSPRPRPRRDLLRLRRGPETSPTPAS